MVPTPETLKAYVQHGLQIVKVPEGNETNVLCNCPFCGRDSKFYVNTDTRAWDCKVCGSSGGFQTFLTKTVENNIKQFNNSKADVLCRSRGLNVKTFEWFGVGFNHLTNSYIVPIYNEDHRLVDVRIYNNGKLMSTSSCKTGLWNAEAITPKVQTVYLCEGEWDGMAMSEVVGLDTTTVAVAVPGATVFKPQWIALFQDKRVIALYDNDDAGRKGSIRCYNFLKPITKELKFLHWTEGTADKYDIRDLYCDTKNREKVLQYIKENMRDEPTGDAKEIKEHVADNVMIYDGEGATAKTIYEKYRKWLHMPDTDVLDVLFGTIAANRMQGDPIWLFLVAPPGGAKSELLQSLAEAKGIHALSTLTAHTLVTGMSMPGGHDPSLIPRLDGKVLVVKDFTTVLNMNQQAREEIFADLRDAYDGEFRKSFGNGINRNYQSKFGIIAGVTPIIDTALEGESALGERFLRWEVESPESIAAHILFLRKATENVSLEDTMRKELREAGETCLNYRFDTDVIIPPELEDRIIYASVMVAMMRGTVPRDKYTKEIVATPYIELGTRLSKQLTKLLIGICMFRRKSKATEAEIKIVQRIAKNTIPARVSRTVSQIMRAFGDKDFTHSEAGEVIKLPSMAVQRYVENLSMLGIVERRTQGGRALYAVTQQIRDMNKKARLF